MSNRSYWFVRAICVPAFSLSSRPIILHPERPAMPGGFILAPNHSSYFDVPCFLAISPRCLDFQSVDVFKRNAFVRLVFNAMNTFYVERSRTDVKTTKMMVERLRAGRIIALFPERGIRRGDQSVLKGGPLRGGTARLARLANVPILPAAIIGTIAYMRLSSWLPIKRIRYAVAYGEPIHVATTDDADADCQAAENRLRAAYLSLAEELSSAAPAVPFV